MGVAGVKERAFRACGCLCGTWPADTPCTQFSGLLEAAMSKRILTVLLGGLVAVALAPGFDRAGGITLGGAQIFFTSTPEPDPDGITWHAQKDVTEYTSLFTAGQSYAISVPNYLSGILTGVMHISASLTFYEPDAA